VPLITVPKKLSEKLGEEASEALVELLRQLQDDTVVRAMDVLEERFARRLAEEIGKVYREMGQLEARLTQRIESLRSDMQSEIGSLRSDMEKLRADVQSEIGGLRTDMERLRTDMERLRAEIRGIVATVIRWMFVFWVGQFVALAGILLAVARFMR